MPEVGWGVGSCSAVGVYVCCQVVENVDVVPRTRASRSIKGVKALIGDQVDQSSRVKLKGNYALICVHVSPRLSVLPVAQGEGIL